MHDAKYDMYVIFRFLSFFDQFRHIICQILIYRFVGMNYSILNGKGKNKFYFTIIWIQDYYYLFILFYLNICYEFKK
jgi:hypothetical protein